MKTEKTKLLEIRINLLEKRMFSILQDSIECEDCHNHPEDYLDLELIEQTGFCRNCISDEDLYQGDD
jgi:hypothetical protein